MGASTKLRIAVSGSGPEHQDWNEAVRASAEVALAGAQERPDALVLGPGVPEPFAQAQRALEGRTALLVATSGLAPGQVQELAALARDLGCPLRFWEPFRSSPGFRFLARLVSGPEPFWRPTRVQSRRLSAVGGARSCDALLDEELAMLDGLLQRPPILLWASLERGPTAAGVVRVLITLSYAGGLTAECTVGLAEASSARRLVVGTDNRCAVLDHKRDSDCLRIFDGARHVDESACTVWQPSLRSCGRISPHADELRAFVMQIAQGRTNDDTVRRRLRVASLALALGRSMQSGRPVDLSAPIRRDSAGLRVIVGSYKKRTAPTSWERPSLKLVPAR